MNSPATSLRSTTSTDPLKWIDDDLAELQRMQLCRRLPHPLASQGAVVDYDGRQLINFASNDYLSLAADLRLIEAAKATCDQEGFGRGASPLICGRAPAHDSLERRLAEFEGTEAALLFPTGFAANAGTIPALADRGDAIFGDAKNHASIIDGCRLSRAEKHVYPHTDTRVLEELLRAAGGYRRRLIVTDTLFSMDGDLAPLPRLAELAAQYDAMLMVDEAHATGVFGEQGRGVVEHFSQHHPDLHQQVHIRVGTLSKALGAAGGFVCGTSALIEWLANRARTYVFSTAQPAAISAAAIAALDIVSAEPERRAELLTFANELRQQLGRQGWDTCASASQIIPLRVGSPDRALQLADELLEQGLWVPAIRPPSVPAGESLLRLSLTAAHSGAMIERLIEALSKLRPQTAAW